MPPLSLLRKLRKRYSKPKPSPPPPTTQSDTTSSIIKKQSHTSNVSSLPSPTASNTPNTTAPPTIPSLTQSTTASTITTTCVLAHPPPSIIPLLHTPSHYFFLNPAVLRITPLPTTNEYLVYEEPTVSFLGITFKLKVTQHARLVLTEEGVENDVLAKAWCGIIRTKTRSVYTVACEEGGSRVTEVFEVKEGGLVKGWVVEMMESACVEKMVVLEDKLVQIAAGY